MPKGITSLCLALILAPCTYAQNAPPAAPPKNAASQGAAADKPDAAASQTARAVMSGEQVIRILDETVNWYRMLGVQQQSSTQPSDLLILYANRQTADRVVALAFELARANAELLSSQAEVEPAKAADPSRSRRTSSRCKRSKAELDKRRAAIQSDIASCAEAAPRRESGRAHRAASEGRRAAERARARERAAQHAGHHGRLRARNRRERLRRERAQGAHQRDRGLDSCRGARRDAGARRLGQRGGHAGGRRLPNSRVRGPRDVGREPIRHLGSHQQRAEAFEQARDDRRYRQAHGGAAENVRADSLGAREADQGACGSRRRASGAARRE